MREAIRGHQGEEHQDLSRALMREAIRGHQGEEHQDLSRASCDKALVRLYTISQYSKAQRSHQP
jgi:hypothetical protein